MAYVDIDQVGMCFPPQEDDPDRHLVKARNVGAVLRNFGRAGAQVVIVSGVIDPDEVPRYVEQCHGSALTFIRLTASQERLLVRNRARGRGEDMVAAVLRDAQALEASTFAAATVSTDGLAVEEVARRVLERVSEWVAAAHATAGEDHAVGEDGPVSDADGPVLWLHGAPAVGKSTIGWQLFMEALGEGTAAFVDLAQLGFLHPTPVDDPEHAPAQGGEPGRAVGHLPGRRGTVPGRHRGGSPAPGMSRGTGPRCRRRSCGCAGCGSSLTSWLIGSPNAAVAAARTWPGTPWLGRRRSSSSRP